MPITLTKSNVLLLIADALEDMPDIVELPMQSKEGAVRFVDKLVKDAAKSVRSNFESQGVLFNHQAGMVFLPGSNILEICDLAHNGEAVPQRHAVQCPGCTNWYCKKHKLHKCPNCGHNL
ncbi:hypothetical protein [Azospirillum tabaci]|uniref:hypothetical protein n=1 Tax=Azospirillum tabaci TaxID=2752310 RepID=UPI001660CC5C|nr:hypothetical protein [Azospirillum tabaci]